MASGRKLFSSSRNPCCYCIDASLKRIEVKQCGDSLEKSMKRFEEVLEENGQQIEVVVYPLDSSAWRAYWSCNTGSTGSDSWACSLNLLSLSKTYLRIIFCCAKVKNSDSFKLFPLFSLCTITSPARWKLGKLKTFYFFKLCLYFKIISLDGSITLTYELYFFIWYYFVSLAY